ncbi:pre-rRNA processing protein FTSJ3 [Tetranychus urticae]|uniref:Putative rRNA methyltransferase n=1 Tax=Tetranychus urticae TaxID=32264 RepID=T1JZF7_TETUR|nr:pre-rRNA processing protein FTSJ3 [Tetranychus urticae]
MGKAKVGKQRKDRFYQLAKETGYRSRAAFKLIQLNRKFEFLQSSKVLIDLCSAPGGWLQVAQKFMPVSSVIIGIDLVPIKPIPNCLTFACDITTPQCRSLIKKELKTWKADVILNDGAPNVGKSWTHDAFAQIRLTLSAVQLATEFLMKGGWFITKIFRSRDYNALMWLLGKLFRKVHATKPQASRHESAEIFVVCEKYLAPDKIDPKFFDPGFLFEEIPDQNDEKKKKAELLKPVSKQKKAKAEGYKEGDTLYHKLNASEFISKTNHIELLSDSNEMVLDTEAIANHASTTDEIKELIKDLKVLGRKEILQLIAWRRKIRAELYPKEKGEGKELEEVKVIPEEELEDEDDEELNELKRKKKKILKERRKLNARMNLGMIQNENELHEEDDMELFTLRHLKNRSELERFQNVDLDILDEHLPNTVESEDEEPYDPKLKKVYFDRHAKDDYDFEDVNRNPDEILSDEEENKSNIDELEEIDTNVDQEEDAEDDEETGGGLLVDLDDRPKNLKDRVFLERGVFNDDEFDDEDDLAAMALNASQLRKEKKEKKALLKEKEKKATKKDLTKSKESRKSSSGGSASKKVRFDTDAKGKTDLDDDESDDDLLDKVDKTPTLSERCKSNVRLNPEELALGSVLIQSAKMRREITDQAWNRYMHSDHEALPSWFKKDEDIFFYKPLPVPASTVHEFKKKLKEINARPIKKVAEANARKRKRATRKLERARKKAEALTDASDMSEREKMATIKNLYKKALKGEKKKELQYVVAKKGKINKRPAGLKGRYKLVDGRLKKDKVAKKRELKSKGKGKGRSKGAFKSGFKSGGKTGGKRSKTSK